MARVGAQRHRKLYGRKHQYLELDTQTDILQNFALSLSVVADPSRKLFVQSKSLPS